MFGGDNELGNILQEAVKLKSAQMGQKRKTYETWPFFVQHTLFHGEKDDFKAWRQLPFEEKIVISERVKEEGNALYAKADYAGAIDKYEEAATLLHYCYSSDPGWRKNNRGIDDDVLVLVEDSGTTDEHALQQKRLRLSCCLNLAASKQKIGKFDEALIACTTALELDPRNVKAFYRRAEARIRPSKATALDQDMAIKDLALAHEIDPTNQPVDKLLVKLRAERRLQREKDQKTFTGMFDRGQIYEGFLDTPSTEGAEEDSLEKRTQDAELLRDLYMTSGREEEAKELNGRIQIAKKAMRERPKTSPDWDNPTDEMVEDARQHGLNILDPVVIAELKRLEREGEGRPPEPGDPSPAPQRGPPIPWGRYAGLLGFLMLAWRMADAGVVGLLLRGAWRGTQAFGSVGSRASEDDEERGSLLAAAYRQVSGLFGEAEDTEL